MLKTFGVFVAVSVMSSAAIAAEPKAMTNSELDQVVAGTYTCCYCPPPENVKGDNGWGNGADLSNAGSDNGGTAASKTANASIPGGGINQNPTTSSGR